MRGPDLSRAKHDAAVDEQQQRNIRGAPGQNLVLHRERRPRHGTAHAVTSADRDQPQHRSILLLARRPRGRRLARREAAGSRGQQEQQASQAGREGHSQQLDSRAPRQRRCSTAPPDQQQDQQERDARELHHQ